MLEDGTVEPIGLKEDDEDVLGDEEEEGEREVVPWLQRQVHLPQQVQSGRQEWGVLMNGSSDFTSFSFSWIF